MMKTDKKSQVAGSNTKATKTDKSILVPVDAIAPLLQAAKAAFAGVRAVRSDAIETGCSNDKSNELGGIMHAIHKVIEQLEA